MLKTLAGALLGVTVGLCVSQAVASRNSSGTMAAINGPYVAGTVISSTAVNARLGDIENELTDSLSRSGKGGMTAVLKGTDGSAAAPAYSFTNDADTGLYRIGANNLGVSVGGAKVLDVGASATAVTGALSCTGDATTAGSIVVDTGQVNAGTIANAPAVHFGGASGGEGILSKRTAGGNQFGLDLMTNGTSRVSITQAGATTVSGALTASSGVTVGSSGTAISASYGTSTSWNPGSILANSCATTTVALSGATVQSPCIVANDGGAGGATALTCSVTSANTVTIKACAIGSGWAFGGADTFRVRVFVP